MASQRYTKNTNIRNKIMCLFFMLKRVFPLSATQRYKILMDYSPFISFF